MPNETTQEDVRLEELRKKREAEARMLNNMSDDPADDEAKVCIACT